jgi:ribosome modulation factor
MANPQEKAWSDGYAAGKKGKPETVCPFKKGGFMAAWQEGWRNGMKARDSAE